MRANEKMGPNDTLRHCSFNLHKILLIPYMDISPIIQLPVRKYELGEYLSRALKFEIARVGGSLGSGPRICALEQLSGLARAKKT